MLLLRVVAVAALAVTIGCNQRPAPAPERAPEVKAPPAETPPPKKQAEPFATPTAKPPPPPAGAVLLAPDLYVQRCDDAHACPQLTQPQGEVHCRELVLGGHDSWRLPDKAEAERFHELGDADALDGFHWTRTPYDEDAGQAWIIDPKSGSKTTYQRERKAFTVRCVQEA